MTLTELAREELKRQRENQKIIEIMAQLQRIEEAERNLAAAKEGLKKLETRELEFFFLRSNK